MAENQKDLRGQGSTEAQKSANDDRLSSKRTFLPGKGSNKWFLLGLIHGLILTVVLIVFGGTGKMLWEYTNLLPLFLVLFLTMTIIFIVLAELVSLVGRNGKHIAWVSAFVVSIASLVGIAGAFEFNDLSGIGVLIMIPVTISLLPIVIIPLCLFLVLGLLVGIIIQAVYERIARNKKQAKTGEG